jgi:redox-sensing transcriptional repressor
VKYITSNAMRTSEAFFAGTSNLSEPTIKRLCQIYGVLVELGDKGETIITSRQLGLRLGTASHNVRKDIAALGGDATSGNSYSIPKLREIISGSFGLGLGRKACVVGLGSFGRAILRYESMFKDTFTLIAGFDSNINKLETISTSVPVFPSYEIPEVIKRMGIDLAILTIPAHAVNDVMGKLVSGGIRGVINFTSVVLHGGDTGVHVSNMNIIGAFHYLAAMMTLQEME